MEQNINEQNNVGFSQSNISIAWWAIEAFLGPFLIFVILSKIAFGQIIFYSPLAHSLLFLIVCAFSVYISYSAYSAYVATREIQLLFVTTAFSAFGMGFLFHALASPGLLFPEQFFDVTEHASLLLGAISFACIGLNLSNVNDFVYIKRRTVLLSTMLFFVTVFFLLTVLAQIIGYSGGVINMVFVAPSILFLLIGVVFLVKKYYVQRTKLSLYLVIGFSMLLNTSIIPLFYEEWSVVWWYFHIIILASFSVILLGLLVSKREETEEGFTAVFKNVSLHSRFSTKFIALTISLSIVPVVSMLFVNYYVFTNSLKKQAIENLVLVAESKEGHIFSYIEGLKIRATSFSSDGHIISSVKSILANNESIGAKKELGAYLANKKMSLDTSIYSINIIGLDGRILASTDDYEIGRDESSDIYLTTDKNLLWGESIISDISIDEHSSSSINTITAIAPLFDLITRERLGYIANSYRTEQLDDILTGRQQLKYGAISGVGGIRDTLDIYLVNRERKMITESKFLGKGVKLNEEVDTPPVRNCNEKGEEMSGVWRDYRGVMVYGASMCIINYGHKWTLVVEITEEEVSQSSLGARNIILALSLPLMLIVSIIGVYFSRRFTQSIVSLTKMANMISGGNLTVRAGLDSTDEVGVLAKTFNNMADTIEATHLEVKKRSDELVLQNEQLSKTSVELVEIKEGLERKVLERTAELEKSKISLETQVADRTQELQQANSGLEEEVLRRTEELQTKLVELERFNKVAVGRELRMVELKEEIALLKKELSEKTSI